MLRREIGKGGAKRAARRVGKSHDVVGRRLYSSTDSKGRQNVLLAVDDDGLKGPPPRSLVMISDGKPVASFRVNYEQRHGKWVIRNASINILDEKGNSAYALAITPEAAAQASLLRRLKKATTDAVASTMRQFTVREALAASPMLVCEMELYQWQNAETLAMAAMAESLLQAGFCIIPASPPCLNAERAAADALYAAAQALEAWRDYDSCLDYHIAYRLPPVIIVARVYCNTYYEDVWVEDFYEPDGGYWAIESWRVCYAI